MPQWIFTVLLSLDAVIILYLAMIMPRLFRRRDFSPWADKMFAHRGLFSNKAPFIFPENSLPAFRRAAERGFGIEFDVRLTRDGIPVVFHDGDLSRVCGDTRMVSELSLAELRELRLFGGPESVPTLAETLGELSSRAKSPEAIPPLIVELKPCGSVSRLCESAARLLDDYPGCFCVESFDPRALLWFRNHRPDVVRGQLSMNFIAVKRGGPGKLILHNFLLNFLSKPDFIAMELSGRDLFTYYVIRRLYHPYAVGWTARTPQQLHDCEKAFDTFIFQDFIAARR